MNNDNKWLSLDALSFDLVLDNMLLSECLALGRSCWRGKQLVKDYLRRSGPAHVVRAEIEFYLKHNADQPVREYELVDACSRGLVRSLQVLISEHRTGLADDQWPSKAVRAACSHGQLDVLELLLHEYGSGTKEQFMAFPTRSSHNGLMLACAGGNLALVKQLCDRYQLAGRADGFAVPPFSHNDITPNALEMACASGNAEVVKFVCERFGATVADVTGGASPLICRFGLDFSTLRNSRHILEYFYYAFHLDTPHFRGNENIILRDAVAKNQLDTVRFLVNIVGLTADDARARQNEALRKASVNDNLEMLQFIVDTFKLTATDARARDNYALKQCGSAQVAAFLVDKFQFTEQDARADNYAVLLNAAGRDARLFEYIVQQFRFTEAEVRSDDDPDNLLAEMVVSSAFENRALDVLRWFDAHWCTSHANAMSVLWSSGLLWGRFVEACHKSDAELIYFLVDELGLDFSNRSLDDNVQAMKHLQFGDGDLQMIKYLIEKGNLSLDMLVTQNTTTPKTQQAVDELYCSIEAAVTSGRMDAIRHLVDVHGFNFHRPWLTSEENTAYIQTLRLRTQQQLQYQHTEHEQQIRQEMYDYLSRFL